MSIIPSFLIELDFSPCRKITSRGRIILKIDSDAILGPWRPDPSRWFPTNQTTPVIIMTPLETLTVLYKCSRQHAWTRAWYWSFHFQAKPAALARAEINWFSNRWLSAFSYPILVMSQSYASCSHDTSTPPQSTLFSLESLVSIC
jgi:hypothetical protein